MSLEELSTLDQIHRVAKIEFLNKGYKSASLRNIVKTCGMTTGAFYGYYKSKEDLFETLVAEQYTYIIDRFKKAQLTYEDYQSEDKINNKSSSFIECMKDLLHYANKHIDECKLILLCSEGTKFSHLVDDLVDIEVKSTHNYHYYLNEQGYNIPQIDLQLEHILVTGMFNTFFEFVIHQIPENIAEDYLYKIQKFYNAGFNAIMEQ